MEYKRFIPLAIGAIKKINPLVKKKLLLLALIVLACNANAQRSTVTLKNGSVLRGKVLEHGENGISLRTRGGSVWKFTTEEVESVENFSASMNIDYKGYYNRTSLGMAMGSEFSPGFQVVNGYSFNSHWEIGLGVGLERFYWYRYIPLFLEGRYTLLDKRTSPFVAANVGYEMPADYFEVLKGGITGCGQVGISHYFSDHAGIYSSAGLRLARLVTVNQWWDDYQTIYMICRAEVRFGFVFR